MTSDEVGAVVIVALWSAMLVIARKALGVRRVLLPLRRDRVDVLRARAQSPCSRRPTRR
jgi:hypothetical protein